MEFLPKLYRSKMRLYRDRPDVLTTGRWWWCPDGAIPIPYYQRFGSLKFDANVDVATDQPLGEVEIIRGRLSGTTNPRYTGQRWCGGEEVWTQGALYSQRHTPALDADGVPLCCAPPPLQGGAAINGSATISTVPLPDLWLRPEELEGMAPGEPITTWPKATGTPRDGAWLNFEPIYSLGFGPLGGGLFDASDVPLPREAMMQYPDLPITGNWTVYTVGLATGMNNNGPIVFSFLDDILPTFVGQVGGRIRYPSVPYNLDGGAPPAANEMVIWTTIRKGDQHTIMRQGVVVAQGTGPTDALTPQLWTASVKVGTSGAAFMPEIMIWASALTAGQQATVFEYLAERYLGSRPTIIGAGGSAGDGEAHIASGRGILGAGGSVGDGSAELSARAPLVGAGGSVGDGEATLTP